MVKSNGKSSSNFQYKKNYFCNKILGYNIESLDKESILYIKNFLHKNLSKKEKIGRKEMIVLLEINNHIALNKFGKKNITKSLFKKILVKINTILIKIVAPG